MQSATSNPTVAHSKPGVPDIHWTELQSLWNTATLDSNLVFPVKFIRLVSAFLESLNDQDTVYFQSVTRQLIVASAQTLEMKSLQKPARCLVKKIAIVARDRAIAMLFLVNEELVAEERLRRVETWLHLEEYKPYYNLDEVMTTNLIANLHNATYQHGVKELVGECSSKIEKCSKRRGKKKNNKKKKKKKKKKKLSTVNFDDASVEPDANLRAVNCSCSKDHNNRVPPLSFRTC